jgi:GNAT superfamily N-acetyltransferase
MAEVPTSVRLKECDTGIDVTAKLVELDPALAKAHIDSRWWKDPRLTQADSQDEEVRHWVWAKLVQKWRYKAYAECAAVQTVGGAIQAATIGLLNGRSLLAPGLGSVIVERLATAPWNRGWLVQRPQYRGAGVGLLFFLICHSYQLGFGGRLSLYSLPLPLTERFYVKRGFVKTGDEKDGMIHFELPEQSALAWLEREGVL